MNKLAVQQYRTQTRLFVPVSTTRYSVVSRQFILEVVVAAFSLDLELHEIQVAQ